MTPNTEIPNAIQDLVRDVVAGFLKLRAPALVFKSYALGAWQVFQGEYPECARHRADFVRLAGEALRCAAKESER